MSGRMTVTVTEDPRATVTVTEEVIRVATIGTQGPPGPQGPQGEPGEGGDSLPAGVEGDLLLHGAAEWGVLNPGAEGEALVVASGVPAWGAVGGGGETYINPHPINIFAVTGSTYEWAMPGWHFSSVTSTGLLGSDRIVAGPILVTRTRTITGAGLNVTTAGAAGQQVRLGLYALDERGLPRTLVADFGVVSIETTGIKILELAENQEVAPGRYATVMVSNGSGGQLSRINVYSNSPLEPLYSNPGNATVILGMYSSSAVIGSFTALPAEILTSEGWIFIGTAPQTSSVWLRMAQEAA